jgi:glycosyltransferase involved in cell wall biosynthesis
MTDNLGSRDFVEPGVNALITPRDPEGIAHAVDRVLSDETLRESLVREGLRTARDFSIEKAVIRFENALKEGYDEFYNRSCIRTRGLPSEV